MILLFMKLCARSAKSLTAGVQGPLKGPGSFGILECSLVQSEPYFGAFMNNISEILVES